MASSSPHSYVSPWSTHPGRSDTWSVPPLSNSRKRSITWRLLTPPLSLPSMTSTRITNGTVPAEGCLTHPSFVGGQADCRTLSEVRMMYGLHDPAIPATRADEIVQSVFVLFDKHADENILKEEFVALLESG